MGLSAGIVGLPNVGKSTIFNALTSGKAATENYPFCTVDPNRGITIIPDDRLEKIARYIRSERIVPAFLELVDIGGLVKGSSKGEGLGNQFLSHIKEVDAIVIVTRCFEDGDIVHVNGSIEAVRDLEIVESELLLKDLETVERAFTRNMKAIQNGNHELTHIVSVLEKVRYGLSCGISARQVIVDDNERMVIADLHLLTMKPMLYVANISDHDTTSSELRQIEAIKAHAIRQNGSIVVSIHGKIESEIMQLPVRERSDYYMLLGINENGCSLLSQTLYHLLNLQTFFTANSQELHAWPLPKGATALDAAACVHSDFAQNFIKADVYTVPELEQARSEPILRASGKIRSEGSDYIINDGDILFFKTSV